MPIAPKKGLPQSFLTLLQILVDKKAVMFRLTRSLRTYSRNLINAVLFTKNTILQAARNPAKLCDIGRTAVIRASSYLFLIPFVVITDENDGLRILQVATGLRQWTSCVANAVVAIRMGYYLSLCLDKNFKWFQDGQFTLDASYFYIWLFFGVATYSLQLSMIKFQEDFVFLYNSAVRLKQRFCGIQLF